MTNSQNYLLGSKGPKWVGFYQPPYKTIFRKEKNKEFSPKPVELTKAVALTESLLDTEIKRKSQSLRFHVEARTGRYISAPI
jgi:hypothetical protein